MNICLLMSGIIKNYDDLDFIKKICNSNINYKFFIFGHCFSFLGSPNIHKEEIDYNHNIMINKDRIKKYFTKISFVKDYEEFDRDGFDNRIYSQWFNVKKALNMANKFSRFNIINYDIIIKLRTDLKINKELLFYHINNSFKENKIIFGNRSCHILQDQLFLGPPEKMNKILNLCKFYYEYSNLKKWKKISDKRKELLKDGRKHIRFGGISEYFLHHHVINNLNENEYKIVEKYWEISR